MLLPTHDGKRQRVSDALFAQTRAELAERFGGVTAYLRSPAAGAWIDPQGKVERDEVVMVEVMTDTLDLAWWREYLQTLEVRFAQDEILARALAVQKL
jgi:hypothetical protein